MLVILLKLRNIFANAMKSLL